MNRRPLRPRAGFTLIELLVVIAIISVLIALLLPAVQSAREAARRAQCVNNLMQLGLAIQNYESAHEVYPPGVVNPDGPIKDQPRGYHVGWIVQILPYMEQKNAYNKLNFAVGVYDPANLTVRVTTINSLLCPSDIRVMGQNNVAVTNYAGCHHDVEAPIAEDNHGVFFLNSRIRYEDIPDGTSQTLFVGEKLVESDLGWASGTRATLRNTGTLPNWLIGGAARPGFGIPPGPGMVFPPPPAEDVDPDIDDDDLLPGETKPQGGGQKDPLLYVGGYSSHHPGGANMLFGDGSVRFIKNTISPRVYQFLGHRADGELISGDEF